MRNPLTTISRRLSPRLEGPWRAMEELQNEMDRWLSNREEVFPSVSNGFDFSPSANLEETESEYILKIDVPGMKKEDFKIEVDNNQLTVSGERKEEKEEKGRRRYLAECYYGSFMRSFTLPHAVSEKDVKAKYSEGVLSVHVPKMESSAVKTVAVQ